MIFAYTSKLTQTSQAVEDTQLKINNIHVTHNKGNLRQNKNLPFDSMILTAVGVASCFIVARESWLARIHK